MKMNLLISIILFTPFVFGNNNIQKQTVAICDEVISSNVDNAATDTILSAKVKLTMSERGYQVEHSPFGYVKFEGHGNTMALKTGCVFHPYKSIISDVCKEDESVLRMRYQYNGGDEPISTGTYYKDSKVLRLTYEERGVFFYETTSDVLIQCQ
ncbi:MAG: hypothetical protein MK008_01645 [Bdellovibrionales bacterium]|nr:hypothetical protein [Bdellovibrionales bacterium]